MANIWLVSFANSTDTNANNTNSKIFILKDFSLGMIDAIIINLTKMPPMNNINKIKGVQGVDIAVAIVAHRNLIMIIIA